MAPAPAPAKRPLFKNILLATDFSPASKESLKYAASLARRYGSSIYLTHVISVDGYPLVSPEFAAESIQKMHEEAQQGFREMMKTGELIELPYKVLIQEGNLWPSIEEVIKAYAIDLLVVGTHGAGAVQKLLIGSVAEEIFRKARIPVLTVGPGMAKEPEYEMEFANILFATDFGISADREAEFAYALAQEHCSRLRILHVLPHPNDFGEDVLTEKTRACEAQLRLLMEARPEISCKLDFQVAAGDPVQQILRIAEFSKADLIVMGAKAKETFAGNIPNTKAYRIASRSHCPVLTVRS
jgi:nucleotide-binding universal stress UspA family protein